MWASLVTRHMSHLTGSFTPIRLIMSWSTRITAYAIVLYLFSGQAETQTEAARYLNIGISICSRWKIKRSLMLRLICCHSDVCCQLRVKWNVYVIMKRGVKIYYVCNVILLLSGLLNCYASDV
jgi:hypothetical protein